MIVTFKEFILEAIENEFDNVRNFSKTRKLGNDKQTKKLHDRLNQHYNYTPEENEVLNKRTKTSYRQYKTYNVRGKVMERASRKERVTNREAVNRIIDKNRLPESITVYHGVANRYRTPLRIARALGISKITLPHYISTSLNVDTANGFASDFGQIKHSHVLVMRLPKGVNAAYSPHHSDLEQELHLAPGHFRITHSDKVTKNGRSITYHYGHYTPKNNINESLNEEFIDLETLHKAWKIHVKSLNKNLFPKGAAPTTKDHIMRIYRKYGGRIASGAVIGAVAGATIGNPVSGAILGASLASRNPINRHIDHISKAYRKVDKVKNNAR